MLSTVSMTARSGLPSRLKSPLTAACGALPSAALVADQKPWSQRRGRTLSEMSTWFSAHAGATTSGLPSPLKSAIARLMGCPEAMLTTSGWKVPLPLPTRTPMVFSVSSATTRSSRPSPSMSTAAMAAGPTPTG